MSLRYKSLNNESGLSFIEVMVTLLILSFGLVMIFKTFLTSLQQTEHLTKRLYASTLLDDRISVIERGLRAYQTLPFDLHYKEVVNMGTKEIEFKQKMDIREVEDFVDVFQLDITLQWEEEGRMRELSRSAYISDFQYQDEGPAP